MARTAHVTGALAGLLAAALLAGCGGDGDRADDSSAALDSAACQAALRGAEEIARSQPGAPVAELRRQALKLCRTGVTPAPEPAPSSASRPGCQAHPDAERTPARPRTSSARLPRGLHARRSGVLPAHGAPTVAGVRLPPGSRCARHWSTGAPVSDALTLARRLAAAFPRTGLWPVLWRWDEDLDGYAGAEADAVGMLDDLDARAILRTHWATKPPLPRATAPFGERFPGLAPPSPGAGTGRDARNPFGALTRYPTHPAEGAPFLVLVAVNRPADVPARLGAFPTETATSAEISAVLRSWEERFGAVVVEQTPATITLIVDAPPDDRRSALLLSAEHHAIAPPDGAGAAGALRDHAALLRAGADDRAGIRPDPAGPRIWTIGWND